MQSVLAEWVRRELSALLVPPICATCRAPLIPAGEAMCSACRRQLLWLDEARCPRCGLALPCRPCPARDAAFSAAWSPLAYDGTARRAVTALKFSGALALADVMAAQIAANLPDGLIEGGTLVPVPLPKARVRTRGFNQADRLARALARRLGLPVASCLRRVGPPTRQMGAGRDTRLLDRNLAVAVRGTVPASAALVDDVHTTGATLDACARALRAAGAERVVCLTYARVLRGA